MIINEIKETVNEIKVTAKAQLTEKAEFLVKGLELEGFKTKEEQINALRKLGSNKVSAANIISNTMIATGIKVLLEEIFKNGKSTSAGKAYVTTTAVLAVADAILLKKITKEAINIINNK